MTSHEMNREMADYTPGAPTGTRLLGGPEIDREVCRKSHCSECGWEGLNYRPFVRRGDLVNGRAASYRAFAVCPHCGNAAEF